MIPQADGGSTTAAPNSGGEEPVAAPPPPPNLTEVLRLRREMAKKSVEEKEKKQEEERRLRQIQSDNDRLERTKQSLEDKLAVSHSLQLYSISCREFSSVFVSVKFIPCLIRIALE